jgi:hypothetical protein
MKKAQAAIEFLTTYGFALIIIIVAIGAFTYYIGFDQTSKIPSSCDFGLDFSCGSYSADNTGVLMFEFTNRLGKTINLTYIRIELPDGRAQILDYKEEDDSTIEPGEKVIVRTYPKYCSNKYTMFTFKENKEIFPIKIYYTFLDEESLPKMATGEVIVDISSQGLDTDMVFNEVNNQYIIEREDGEKKYYPIEGNCNTPNPDIEQEIQKPTINL